MITIVKIMCGIMLSAVAIGFVWAIAELTIETIKEKHNGDKSNR